MKRFIVITTGIAAICAAMFYVISMPHHKSGVRAEGGVFDLTAADFDGTVFSLDGEWEFYFGSLYTPEDFAEGISGGDRIPVPLSWNRAGYPLAGCATYRLTILTSQADLMMFIPQIINSSIVWVNGVKVFEGGEPGKSAEETVRGTRNALVPLGTINGRAEIIIQAANYNFMSSGLTYHIDMGQSGTLTGDVISRRIGLAFVLGMFMAMALYHIVLFLHRRKDWVYLAFAMVCLFASLRFFFGSNAFGDLILPDGMGPGVPLWLMLFLVFHIASLIWFMHTVFSVPFTEKGRRAVYGICFGASFLFLVPQAPLLVVYLILIPLIWLMIDAVRSGRWRENRYNGLFLFALALYILWYPVNILLVGNRMFSTGIIPNLFLVLCQCVMLSASYAETRRREEELARKADFYHRVAHELLTPLTVVSTSIQVAAFRPEEASEQLRCSQAEIMKIADRINEVLKEGDA